MTANVYKLIGAAEGFVAGNVSGEEFSGEISRFNALLKSAEAAVPKEIRSRVDEEFCAGVRRMREGVEDFEQCCETGVESFAERGRECVLDGLWHLQEMQKLGSGK